MNTQGNYMHTLTTLLVGWALVAGLQSTHASFLDVQKVNPRIRIDLKYATVDNFTGKKVYPDSARAYLLSHVAHALDAVQKNLEKQGLGLLIWDAYRPLSVQRIFWEVCPDERYVSNPAKGGGLHTRGASVDLTVVNLQTGEYLDMGSAFDDFSEKAHWACTTISKTAQKNREILKKVMEDNGFVAYPYEWWHFNFRDWKDYSPCELDFEVLCIQ